MGLLRIVIELAYLSLIYKTAFSFGAIGLALMIPAHIPEFRTLRKFLSVEGRLSKRDDSSLPTFT